MIKHFSKFGLIKMIQGGLQKKIFLKVNNGYVESLQIHCITYSWDTS